MLCDTIAQYEICLALDHLHDFLLYVHYNLKLQLIPRSVTVISLACLCVLYCWGVCCFINYKFEPNRMYIRFGDRYLKIERIRTPVVQMSLQFLLMDIFYPNIYRLTSMSRVIDENLCLIVESIDDFLYVFFFWNKQFG